MRPPTAEELLANLRRQGVRLNPERVAFVRDVAQRAGDTELCSHPRCRALSLQIAARKLDELVDAFVRIFPEVPRAAVEESAFAAFEEPLVPCAIAAGELEP